MMSFVVAHGNTHDWHPNVFSKDSTKFKNMDIISLNEPFKKQMCAPYMITQN